MNDSISDIQEWYDNASESEDARLERHQLEYDITWRYLERFLPSTGSVLEIGAATGRYTQELAKRGYQVTAFELSETLLAHSQHRLTEAGLHQNVTFVVGDARDLSAVSHQEFDAILLMGPMYHLVVESDRLQALQQAYSCLKPGGMFLSAWLSRFGILGQLMEESAGWIEEQDVVRALIDKGQRPKSHPKGGFRGYFATSTELVPLHEKVGFATHVLAAAEPAISANDESYNRLEGIQRQQWLDLLFEVSREPSSIGSSRHLLYIGQKPEW